MCSKRDGRCRVSTHSCAAAVVGDLAGQGKARQGKARQGKARQGKARQGKARQGKASGCTRRSGTTSGEVELASHSLLTCTAIAARTPRNIQLQLTTLGGAACAQSEGPAQRRRLKARKAQEHVGQRNRRYAKTERDATRVYRPSFPRTAGSHAANSSFVQSAATRCICDRHEWRQFAPQARGTDEGVNSPALQPRSRLLGPSH